MTVLRAPQIFLILALLITKSSISQINWNTIGDSIKLSPQLYPVSGSVTINMLGSILSPDNVFYLDYKNKMLYVNNFDNLYKFPFDQVSKTNMADFGETSGAEIYDSELKDKIIKAYRKSIYSVVDLNVLSFTYSKRNKLAVTKEGRLYVKNEKQVNGKICSAGIDYINILTEDGEILTLNDGDFLSLKAAGITTKNCKTLYNLVFREFKYELENKIKNWEKYTVDLDLSKLITEHGPLHSIKEINSELKQFEWNWPIITYNVDLSSSSRQISTNSFTRSINYFGRSNTSIYGSVGSSLFLYGNSYRSYSSDGLFSGVSGTISNVSQNGTVTMLDDGASITIIKDKSGKTISLRHKGIFSELNYGSSFRFIQN